MGHPSQGDLQRFGCYNTCAAAEVIVSVRATMLPGSVRFIGNRSVLALMLQRLAFIFSSRSEVESLQVGFDMSGGEEAY